MLKSNSDDIILSKISCDGREPLSDLVCLVSLDVVEVGFRVIGKIVRHDAS